MRKACNLKSEVETKIEFFIFRSFLSARPHVRDGDAGSIRSILVAFGQTRAADAGILRATATSFVSDDGERVESPSSLRLRFLDETLLREQF